MEKPSSTRDFAFFFEGLRQGRLLVQKCDDCGRRRHPAGPMCPSCQSLRWSADALGTTGTIYSYVVHHHPPMPDYPSPHTVVLVDMAPDIRVLGALTGCAPQDIHIGMQVQAEFVEHGHDFTLHRFRPTVTE